MSLKIEIQQILDSSSLEELSFISNFYPIGKDYNYAVTLNKLCDLMILRLKKLFHLVLSEIAAPTYDNDYGSVKIGTKAIMEFEEVVINEIIQRLKYEQKHSTEIAVDVGCGTGRHSLNILTNEFKSVYGFDFSPKMVEEAKRKKRVGNKDNVVFSISDMEYEKVPYEDEFHGKTDLIIASFGMGSFVEDTSKMLRRFYEWLTPGGRIFLSFYNKRSILLEITPSWRDTSLSAHIDIETNTLQVQLNQDTVFQIFCKPYDNNIQSEITKKFEIISTYSYPTTLALLPNSLLQDPTAEKLFRHVDQKLSKESNQFYGHYVLVVAKKPDVPVINGHKKILEHMRSFDVFYTIIEHDMVLSVEDVIRELSLTVGMLVKSVIFSIRGKKDKIVCILPHVERVNKVALSKQLGIPQSKLKFSTENEILAFGFSIGGIPPFGFPDDAPIQYYAHPSIKNESSISEVFMGAGDNTKTLKMDMKDFVRIIADYNELPM